MPNGASGLDVPTAAPTTRTRKNVPIASTTNFAAARGPAATSASYRSDTCLAWRDMTMDTASPLAVRWVLDAGGHLVRLPAVDQSYLPAVSALGRSQDCR